MRTTNSNHSPMMHMHKVPSPQCKGFTLLEILITVVVLSTGLVLVLQVLQSVLHIWNYTTQRTSVVMDAQEQFARLRYEAARGESPSAGERITVHDRFQGHAGLYHITYQVDHNVAGAGRYEMLLFLSPEEDEEQP